MQHPNHKYPLLIQLLYYIPFCATFFRVRIYEAHDSILFHSMVFFPVLDNFLLHRFNRARKHQSKAMAAMNDLDLRIVRFDSIIICSI